MRIRVSLSQNAVDHCISLHLSGMDRAATDDSSSRSLSPPQSVWARQGRALEGGAQRPPVASRPPDGRLRPPVTAATPATRPRRSWPTTGGPRRWLLAGPALVDSTRRDRSAPAIRCSDGVIGAPGCTSVSAAPSRPERTRLREPRIAHNRAETGFAGRSWCSTPSERPPDALWPPWAPQACRFRPGGPDHRHRCDDAVGKAPVQRLVP